MFLKDNKELVLDAYKVAKVLDILVEESMKSRDTNDVLAIKCHYFATLIRQASKFLKKPDDTLDGFVKRLLLKLYIIESYEWSMFLRPYFR